MKYILKIIASVLLLCPTFMATAQVTPLTPQHFLTNGTTVLIAGAGQSNIVASSAVVIELRKGSGLGIEAEFSTTNASTAQVGISFVPSLDRTNFATMRPLWLIGALNGTAGVITWTNIPDSVVSEFCFAKILAITNGHDASLWVTNCRAGIRN